MRIPRLPARPWVAVAAVVAAAAILVATGVGQTHATEPTNQQVDENTPGGTAVGTPLNASTTGTTVSYTLSGPDAASFTINPATGEVLMGGLEMPEDATYTATISVTDGVDGEWREDRTADDTLSLTMTIINPNIVIESSSRSALPKDLWVDDGIVVTTNEVNDYYRKDQAMIYDRATQQHLEDRSFPVAGRSYPSMQGVWSDGTTLFTRHGNPILHRT